MGERVEVAPRGGIAGRLNRLPEHQCHSWPEGPPEVKAITRPPILCAPDPDRDDRGAGLEGDDRHAAASPLKSGVGLGVHTALREDAGERTGSYRPLCLFECPHVSRATPERDLLEEPQRPTELRVLEELGGHEEARHPLAFAAGCERKEGAVERAHVVAGKDGGTSGRHALDADHPVAEADTEGRTDQRQSNLPPAAQFGPSASHHGPDATAALRILARAVDLRGLQDIAARRYEEFVDVLRAIVDVDSGSYTPQGVNVVAGVCQARFERAGWRVERIGHRPAADEPQLGDLLIGRLGGSGGPSILMIGHTDTVFDVGTVAERPFRIDGHRALGPGVSDMKGGLLLGFLGVEVLQETGFDGFGSLTYVCNPDEEIGSPWSSDVIRFEASRADIALVLEGARETGEVVSSRKGVSDYRIEVIGRAAHAGVEPEKGHSAVLEAAHKIVALHELNGRWPGVTVNAGVVRGGTRPNVIAERCEIQVDVRSPREESLAAAEAEVERIANTHRVPDITVRVTDGKWHRPMEKGEAGARLAALAIEVAKELGFELRDTATGGASDANTASAAGVPTLDGLGPVGGGDHSAGEWIDLASVVPRISLLAGLISKLGMRSD